MMSRGLIVTMVICAAALIVGCGGTGPSQHSAQGGISVAVIFPPQRPAVAPKDLPLVTNSVRIAVLSNDPPAAPVPFAEELIARSPAPNASEANFANVPVGDYLVRAFAYASTDGSGPIIARAEAPIAVVIGQDAQVVLVTEALVMRVEVIPSTLGLAVGDSSKLTVTCYDADNNVVLCNVQWTASDGSVASVDATGFVIARTEGSATVTATEVANAAADSCAVTVAAAGSHALAPTRMTVYIPPGGNNQLRDGLTSDTAFVDDFFLDTITFGATTYSATGGSFRAALRGRVNSARAECRPMYGDLDTGSDLNPNPYVKAGLLNEGDPVPPAMFASTDPAVQDPAVTAALYDLSLSEGADGIGGDYVLDIVFQNAIVDDDAAADGLPELIVFERGTNSSFDVQVITGGTFAAPTFAPNTISVSASDLDGTSYFSDTIQTGTGQRLGVVGLDLSSFGLGAGQAAAGVRLTSTNGTGADYSGVFLSAVTAAQFGPIPSSLLFP